MIVYRCEKYFGLSTNQLAVDLYVVFAGKIVTGLCLTISSRGGEFKVQTPDCGCTSGGCAPGGSSIRWAALIRRNLAHPLRRRGNRVRRCRKRGSSGDVKVKMKRGPERAHHVS